VPTDRVTVVIPTYNEAENLPELVSALRGLAIPSLRILIVDDNSPDGTGTLADQMAAAEPDQFGVIHRSGKLGLGSAYLTGFRRALELGSQAIGQMDADFSHDPAHLPLFLEAAQRADFVLGSRYLDGNVTVVNWPIRRLLLSYGANVYARIVTGMRLWDATGGFKCFHRRVLAAIDLREVRSNGYAFQIEMSFRAWRLGFRIKEIPIVFVDRADGTSKMSGAIVREAIWMVWRLRLQALLGRL